MGQEGGRDSCRSEPGWGALTPGLPHPDQPGRARTRTRTRDDGRARAVAALCSIPESEVLQAGAGGRGGVGGQVEEDAEQFPGLEGPVRQADHQVAVQPVLLQGPSRGRAEQADAPDAQQGVLGRALGPGPAPGPGTPPCSSTASRRIRGVESVVKLGLLTLPCRLGLQPIWRLAAGSGWCSRGRRSEPSQGQLGAHETGGQTPAEAAGALDLPGIPEGVQALNE